MWENLLPPVIILSQKPNIKIVGSYPLFEFGWEYLVHLNKVIFVSDL